jgi:hypothetical protein
MSERGERRRDGARGEKRRLTTREMIVPRSFSLDQL